MIKNNLFAQILIGALVLLLLMSSIQMLGIGSQIGKVEFDEDSQVIVPKIPRSINEQETQEDIDLKKLVEVAAVKPIFSTTREPFVGEAEEHPPEEPPIEIAELKAQITGIVITPENSYAMILDTTTNKRKPYKVGMPLDGELGGWTITSIKNREVTLVSDDEKSEKLDLKVSGGTKPVAPLAANKKSGTTAKTGDTTKNNKPLNRKDKKKNADDIRKKIAERRAQMRAEAANKKNEGDN